MSKPYVRPSRFSSKGPSQGYSKMVNGSKKQAPIRASSPPEPENNHLEWLKGDRAIFWAWVYIRTASVDTLEIDFQELGPHEKPYETLVLARNPLDNKERLSIIQCWLKGIEERLSFGDAYKIMLQMRDEWFYIREHIKPVDWLRKNEEHTRWLWERLKKEDIFTDSIPHWFNPANSSERFLAINATIDFFMPHQTIEIGKVTKKKNAFTAREKRNYKNKTVYMGKKPACQVNIKITPDTKVILDKLVALEETTQSALIEWLIKNHWSESRASTEEKN